MIAYCWVFGVNCWVLMKCLEDDGHRVMGDYCWVLMECLELDEVIDGINYLCRFL
jgi:hypothetical protein